jgi:hypothetical protein
MCPFSIRGLISFNTFVRRIRATYITHVIVPRPCNLWQLLFSFPVCWRSLTNSFLKVSRVWGKLTVFLTQKWGGGSKFHKENSIITYFWCNHIRRNQFYIHFLEEFSALHGNKVSSKRGFYNACESDQTTIKDQ